MISRDEVTWLYRCLLNRDPESEQVVQDTMAQYENFAVARQQIMASREFSNAHMASVFYRPDASTMPATKARTESLALATIVKDEERYVEIMLRSCLPVVDFVAVIDTGSTDETVPIVHRVLEAAGVRHLVKKIVFRDFSQARNTALDSIPDDISWSLMIDADEHLVPEDYWRLNALLDADVDAWQLPRFNFFDRSKIEAPKPYPDYQGRLFRNRTDRPIRFKGAVHEEPVNVARWGFAPASEGGRQGYIGGPHIHHMGQVDLPLERWQQKHAFYTRLLQADALRVCGANV